MRNAREGAPDHSFAQVCVGRLAENSLQTGGTGAGSGGSFNGKVNKFVNALGASPAATTALEPKLGLQLTGCHEASPSGLADIRFGDTVAQTDVHGVFSIDYEKRSHYLS